jgi:hypothetical protein
MVSAGNKSQRRSGDSIYRLPNDRAVTTTSRSILASRFSATEEVLMTNRGDEQEARQQAIALFSGLVGAMVLSRAVKKSDPTLSDEILSSARNTVRLKTVHA